MTVYLLWCFGELLGVFRSEESAQEWLREQGNGHMTPGEISASYTEPWTVI